MRSLKARKSGGVRQQFFPLFFFVFILLFVSKGQAETILSIEALLSQNTRLVIFSPHPDDETLGAGGLIQRVLRIGGKVKVVFMTSGDGYLEGVEMEDHITHPTAQDYCEYGTVREKEAQTVLATLGMKKQDIIFLGFPDGGLCSILFKYRFANGPNYMFPFTMRDRPALAEVLLPNAEYNSEDLS